MHTPENATFPCIKWGVDGLVGGDWGVVELLIAIEPSIITINPFNLIYIYIYIYIYI